MRTSRELQEVAANIGDQLTEEGLTVAEIAYVGATLSGAAVVKAFGIKR